MKTAHDLKVEYILLKDALAKEVAAFDELRRAHDRAVDRMTKLVTQKWVEYQRQRLEEK